MPKIIADGSFVACGSDEGSVTIWRFDSGAAARLPCLEASGAPIGGLSWSAAFQAVAACSLTAYAPIVLACFDPRLPAVVLRGGSSSRSAALGHGSSSSGLDGGLAKPGPARNRRSTGPLPERLTPENVRALLEDVRTCAEQRGLYKRPLDPDGRLSYLVIPERHAEQHHVSGSYSSSSISGSGSGFSGSQRHWNGGQQQRRNQPAEVGAEVSVVEGAGCEDFKAPWELGSRSPEPIRQLA